MPANDPPGFLRALERRPILLDAAMGTRLVARRLDLLVDDPALWVLDRPEAVLEVHRLDVLAGSDALLTDTFGANRPWLDRFGRGSEAAALNREAVRLARLAIGGEPGRFVLGSIGPTASDRPEALEDQAGALIEAGADGIFLETHRAGQALAALRALRGCPVPILVGLFAWPDRVEETARSLDDLGAAAIGANCQDGMTPALELARKLRLASDLPLLMKPSAGRPGSPLHAPESFEEAVPELIALGVRLLGGCCGATEAHVSSLRRGLGDRVGRRDGR